VVCASRPLGIERSIDRCFGEKVGELAQTAIEFQPMQKGASFNLQAVKEQVEAAIAKGKPGD
jgi:hypothetical protein